MKRVKSVGRILAGAALAVAAAVFLSGHVDVSPRGVFRGLLARFPRAEAGVAGATRVVTAYNVGAPEQTGGDPCIGASGHDLCNLVERGLPVCAANFVSLGTILTIEDYGECVVLDRMNGRFAHRVDIAMAPDEVDEAQAFGRQKRLVEVLD